MRASSFWLVVIPVLLMAGGAWNGWLLPEMDAVRFSRAQVDVRTLQKSMEGKTVLPEDARLDLEKIVRKSRVGYDPEQARDPWGHEYRAALVLDGSGRLAFFSAGADERSCLTETSSDDIFAENEFSRWVAAQSQVGWYRSITLLAAGFCLSQLVARWLGAFPRPPVEN